MAKAPASQFYWGDLRRDTEYHLLKWASRGIWVEMLSCMHFSRERGKLEGTSEQLSRLIGCTLEEFQEAKKDIAVTKTGDVTDSNGFVTIINRRMYREERERILTRFRVQKHRNDKEKRKGNEEVTPPSSSSSSSPTPNTNSKEGEDTPFQVPSKEEIEEASESMILNQVEYVCLQLYKEKIFPEVNAFKNKMLKAKKNPRSILHTLSRAYIKREFEEGPWAYCQKIIEIESAKYNARDYGKTS